MSREENDELIKYRFNKAQETLVEVETLIQNGFWNLAINRLYYACYYSVSALLASMSVFPKSNAGTKQMFGLHFVKTRIINEQLNQFYTYILKHSALTVRGSGN